MCRSRAFRSQAIAVAAVLSLAGTAHAQLSTATIKGQISRGEAAAPAGTSVVAVNKDSGFTYRTSTGVDGSYVLTGLAPGEYEIRVTGPEGTAKTQVLTLLVGEVASLDLTLGAVEEMVVTGSPQRRAVKTSEVGTNVSPKMIEALPAPTHNFLASADLAPGVVFVQDQAGFTRIQSGAQDRNNVNVYIDGVSQKNNILRGGLSAQDTTRGNPFPQSAIAEFKVITQNYKAEFDQVSGAAITAVTKSGTNELHGNVYYDRMETDWRNRSPFEAANERAGQVLLPSNKSEFGLSLGGPIKEDVVHYFVAYDGKDINDSRQVVPRNLDKFQPGAGGLVPVLAGKGGSHVDPFREHLLFGKANAQMADDRKLTASLKLRLESDHVAEDRNLSAPGNDKERANHDFRLDVLHEWNIGADWLSESRAGYQNAVWNPKSAATSSFIKYKVNNVANTLAGSADVIFDGGSPDAQKRGQSGFNLAQDMTYIGSSNHVFKGGAKVNVLKYDLSGTSRSVDVVEALVDAATGVPYYDGTNCTGTNVTNGGNNSDQCKIDRALAPASVSVDNVQFGLYLQDDWAITKRLELNLGARWDYETNMLNNGYVTPADRVAALYGPDTRIINGNPAPAGQTYAQSLALGGVNIADYISDGHSRKAYLGAIAPRLGFSYDVLGNKNTVVFGGYGRSYDRAMANHALDEKQKNAQVGGGEIWLIRNDFKMPYTDQFSIGVRQAVVMFNVEATVSELDGKNQFQWFHGNRDFSGGWATQPWFDPYWGGPQGYGALILGDFVGQTRTRSLMLKAEKPYTKVSGWTATVAYTLSDAKTKHREWDDDIFDWSYGKPFRPWNPSRLVDKHRLVAAAMADDLLPWGVTLSGKYTYGSGLARRIVACYAGCNVYEGTSPSFKQFDLGLAKLFKTGPGVFALRADVFNVFNTTNYLLPANPFGGGAPGGNSIGGDNLDADKPEALRGPMRSLRISGSYSF